MWELSGYVKAEGWIDMMKLIGAFHEYADMHKNIGDSLNI
jgi:hypothetical protein